MQRIRTVDIRRDVEGLLSVHERQAPEIASLTAVARAHMARIETIEAEQYTRDKSLALVVEAQTETGRTFAMELERLVGLVPAPRVEAEVNDFPSELLHRLSFETTVAGISALLREAEENGHLRAFAPYGMQGLRRLAADEQRQHRAPSAGSAFNAWSAWSAKVGTYGRAIDPDAVRKQRQTALKERGLAVADVIGLRGVVEQALRRATVPESTPSGGESSGLVFGNYWQK